MQDAKTILKSAVYSNAYSPVLPQIRSTGIRSNISKHRSEPKFASPGLEFLINSRLQRKNPEYACSVRHYLEDMGVKLISLNGKENTHGAKKIDLPDSEFLDMSFSHVLSSRRSERIFTGDNMILKYVATILRAACGVSKQQLVELSNKETSHLNFRTIPSAGGLYPIDLYVVSLNVKKLDKGIYRYLPLKDQLLQVGDDLSANKFLYSLCVPEKVVSISRANVVYLLVSRSWKSMRKYGERGMRFAFHEAGSIAQNIHLASTALGVGTVDCASFYDDEAHQALELDGVCTALLHCIVSGVPPKS